MGYIHVHVLILLFVQIFNFLAGFRLLPQPFAQLIVNSSFNLPNTSLNFEQVDLTMLGKLQY